MGEIFRAYASLSRTLHLGLTGEQIMRAEGALKSMYAQKSNPAAAAKGEQHVTENFEFKVSIQQRPRAATVQELSKLAKSAAYQV